MNTISIVGVILIVLGLVGLIYGGITYTTQKNVIDVGDLEVKVDQENRIAFPPIAGAAALAVGLTLLFVGRRQPARA